MTPEPDWRSFEKAVAEFIKTLPGAERVDHNCIEPDPAHGGGRQRDVMVEFKMLGHFKTRMLISCKRLKRMLGSTDVEHFWAELLRSSASAGVLYAFSGFNENALAVAKSLGIHCCQLFDDQPPQVPEVLRLKAYFVEPRSILNIRSWPLPGWPQRSMGELLRAQTGPDGKKVRLNDLIHSAVWDSARQELNKADEERRFPGCYSILMEIPAEAGESVLELGVDVRWDTYSGALEAYRVKGSYEFTGKDFKGTLAFPSIDLVGDGPGDGWIKLDAAPESISNILLIVGERVPASDDELRRLDSHQLPE